MKCIYCNTPLAEIDYCPGCGADVTLLKRIGRISNLLYNRGLEKAQVRDMSGAITCLQQSLKFNKENTDARNLLGLCWYETGEVVQALSEWVISKNLQPHDNPANGYLNELQNSKNQLDVINQSIRKYNQSIEYCRQNNEDMAMMQLRKVVSQNPKLVKAQQLLALLYMKHNEFEKARRILKKALAIDNTNTNTLRYLTEIEEVTGRSSSFGRGRRRAASDTMTDPHAGGTLRYMSGTETIITPTTFRDSSRVATFINIGLGVLLGGAIVWFMAVPATRQSISEEANRQVTDANLQMASGNVQLSDLQDQMDNYKSQVEDANSDRDDALAKVKSYEDLLSAANTYISGDTSAAANAVTAIDGGKLDGNAKTLYDTMKNGVSVTLFNTYYQAGTTAYMSGDYQTAADQLKKAVESDENGTNSSYFNALLCLAFSYYYQGDMTNANKYFTMLSEKYPDQASAYSGYINETANGGTSASTQGEASMQNGADAASAAASQGTSSDASGTSDTSGGITVYGDNSSGTGSTSSGDNSSGTGSTSSGTSGDSYAAWTDPNTGQVYDQYGNLYYG